MANIQPVTENAAWSGWCWKHSRYVVKNDAWGHFENPGLPWYTPEGDYAARHSNLTYGSRLTLLDKEMIQAWMKGPFHALGMIDPKLLQVGFASYREDIGTTKAVGTLDVLSGRGPIPPSVSYPVMWPANGKTVDLRSYHGLERPDPLTSSPGYTAPTGLPITLQIGPGNVLVNVSGSSFSVGGASLEHFTIDETDYYNPNAEVQAQERASLNSRDAIILIPKKPLAEGHEYAASITANGTTYRWSFKVKETKKPAVKLDAPFVSTKTSKRPTFRISWKATDPYPSSGIHSYTVRYRPANSRDWMNWKVNTTSTYGYFKGAAGRTYYFRVRVKDNDGN